ncbi:MAG: RlpA-like double-psi beta-barrel domain-containing protein [Mycobacteriales bacterium]|nr:hypothetical protein [Frankia sp.]
MAVLLACAAVTLPGRPAEGAGRLGRSAVSTAPRHWSAAELAGLQQQLDAATAAAQLAADEVIAAAARTAHIRVAMDMLAEQHDDAQQALDDRARELYMHNSAHDPLDSLLAGFRSPEVAIATAGETASLRSDRGLVAALTVETAAAKDLRRRADAVHRALATKAEAVYAAQDRARELLATATEAFAADQRAQAALRARAAALDAMSATISNAVAPAVTARGRAQAAAEEPIIAALEATTSDIPVGYRRTGQIISGVSSWYGPGFVGNPTSSGAPYDPERLTAAMTAVPLGTVVHVSTADGHAVNLLVNDHGPYVGDRVIDVSRAGARALGFSGLQLVTIEVLDRR